MKKYLLHPGYVISKTDGDRHYITETMLMKLYNVPPKECVTFLPYRPYPNQDELIDLYPMGSGEYKDMQKQEEEKMKPQINTLSFEEKKELFRLIRADIDMVINNKLHLSEINEPPDTPMKAYIRQAKMNVLIKKGVTNEHKTN